MEWALSQVLAVTNPLKCPKTASHNTATNGMWHQYCGSVVDMFDSFACYLISLHCRGYVESMQCEIYCERKGDKMVMASMFECSLEFMWPFISQYTMNQWLSLLYITTNEYILIRSNKMQQYAGIYLLQNHSLHVSGVHRTHHQENLKL